MVLCCFHIGGWWHARIWIGFRGRKELDRTVKQRPFIPISIRQKCCNMVLLHVSPWVFKGYSHVDSNAAQLLDDRICSRSCDFHNLPLPAWWGLSPRMHLGLYKACSLTLPKMAQTALDSPPGSLSLSEVVIEFNTQVLSKTGLGPGSTWARV